MIRDASLIIQTDINKTAMRRYEATSIRRQIISSPRSEGSEGAIHEHGFKQTPPRKRTK